MGKIESEFLSRVGLCLDPFDSASQDIVQKALKAMRPSAAKNNRDRQARTALRQRVLEELLQGSQIPKIGVYPGMGNRWGGPMEEQVAVRISAESLHRLTEKIVRGIFYVEDKQFIEPPYVIEFFALDSDGAKPIQELLDRLGRVYAREPGIIVHRAVLLDDGISSLFEIEFWRQFKMYASVMPIANNRSPDEAPIVPR